jgi:hypothetical protein
VFTARYELSPDITEVESVYSAVRTVSLYNRVGECLRRGTNSVVM